MNRNMKTLYPQLSLYAMNIQIIWNAIKYNAV